ncbi:MAG TPA: DUF3152 domain-containing protein [Micromonosporaceae bacterium]|nr:DUF3152 domain-containing protein [Micromonosporaceae bacterium]
MSPRHRGGHRHRSRHRYQPLLVAAAVLAVIGAGLVLVDHLDIARASSPGADQQVGVIVDPSTPVGPSAAVIQSPAPSSSAATQSIVALDIPFPHSGPQTFQFATTTGSVLGTSGPIRHFRLALESNIDVVSMADFTAKVDETLGDPRSWIAGGKYRLQQVPRSSSYDFTVYLVTSNTTRHMCAPLPTNGFTSCRQGSHVVLNLDRYMTSVAGYRSAAVPLDTYRTYMINHEVGHALGHDHERCPAKGALAPVMQQQTLGLHGCVANPWPYVDGEQYNGPTGSY